jgi:hypothetical protein
MSLDEKDYGNIFVYYSEADFTEFLEGLGDYTDIFE